MSALDDQLSRVELLDRLRSLESEVQQLRRGMVTRSLIGQVVGILSSRYELTTDNAWGLLRNLSNQTNIKLADIARVLVAAHDRTDLDGCDAHAAALLAKILDERVTWTVRRSIRASADGNDRVHGPSGD